MATKSRDTLKGYFKTGARPTEQQFADLVDSMATTTEVPRPQTSVSGSASGGYVYSTGGKTLDSVMAAGHTCVIQNEGNLVFRAHVWNPKNEAGNYYSTVVPIASTTANGAMSKAVFSRLGTGASIYEQTASLNSVTISYPNWATGGNRTFTLNAATTARAGVMTAADKKALDNADRIRTFDCVLTPYAATGSYPGPDEVGGEPYMLAVLISSSNAYHEVCVNINDTWVSLEDITEIGSDLSQDDRIVFDANLGHYRVASNFIFWLSGDTSFGEHFGFITGYYVENQNYLGTVTKLITEVDLHSTINGLAERLTAIENKNHLLLE